MKFSVDVKTFLKAVAHGQSIVEKRTTVPVLSHILINVTQQKLQVTATDLDMVISETIPAVVDIEGSCCVPAGLIFDIIRKVDKQDRVNFILDSLTGRLTLSCRSLEFCIPILTPENFPDISQIPFETSFKISGEILARILDETKFCMAQDEKQYHLGGIYFHKTDDNCLRCVATDMHRIALSEVKIDLGNEFNPITVERKTVFEIRKLIGSEEIKISTSPSRIQFEFQDEDNLVRLSARLLEGKFPGYQKLFNTNFPRIAKIDRHNLDNMLSRVAIVANDKTRSAKFLFSSNKLIVSAMSHDLGSAREELGIEYLGNDVHIQYNVAYILDITRELSCEFIEINFDGPYDATLIRPENSTHCQYIVMPIVA